MESLKDRPRTPHHCPRQQSAEELKLVKRYAKNYRGDLLLGYQKACSRGYSRSYGCFKRTATKLVRPEKKRRTRKNKPYQRADYPGQKVQIDVKYVPVYCVVNGEKCYQFTAKDECTRWTYRAMYAEQSTYSAKDFLESLVKAAPFPIRMIQTDNGTEFTNALLVTKSKHKTLFEEAMLEMGIAYHRIRIATPRHNGKVERQHRTDELRFYKHLRMYSLADGRRPLAVYQRASSNYIMTCLGMRSPNQILELYCGVM
ncbi:MAG: DDE-type integrase/transposase/recombinase [Aristaeellaceae bacterium]